MQQAEEGWYDADFLGRSRPASLALTSAYCLGDCIDAETCDGFAAGED